MNIDLQGIAIHEAIRLVVWVLFFSISVAIYKVYRRVRRPDWAENPGKVKVPWGSWIIAAVVILTASFLAAAILRDPLAGR
jgi:hypothetical protein